VQRLPPSRISALASWQRAASKAGIYFELTKPRVVALIVFTAVVGMLLASPGSITPQVFIFATVGISLAAGSAATFNHILDRRADAIMARTRARPLPSSHLSVPQAAMFGASLALSAGLVLVLGVNLLTAVLTLLTLVGYSVIYTVFLKPRTPQNIVIGGAAGAAPPVLGWAAVTGEVTLDAMLLFLIVFVWTPPHFWALALYREKDYANANIPMLPVTHGSRYTRRCMLIYALVLAVVCVLPFASGMSGTVYLIGALALNARFVAYAWQLDRHYSDALARRMFRFSISFLSALFALLLFDRYVLPDLGSLRPLLDALVL
jgi:protoheme IX farnesyltransferase